MSLRSLLVLGALLAVPALALADPVKWGVGPTLVDDDADHTRIGARAHLDWKSDSSHIQSAFSWSRYAEVNARYVWVESEVLVPQETELALRAGQSWSLSKANPVADSATSMDELPSAGGEAFDYGVIRIGVHARYEAAANRTEHNVTGGAELRYARVGWQLMPSVLATFDFVKPVQSDVRDALDQGNDGYQRLMLRGYWLFRYQRMTGEVDASIFRSYGLDAGLEALDWKDGSAVEATVAYHSAWKALGPVMIETVYLKYASGQVPTNPVEAKAWTIGVDLRSE